MRNDFAVFICTYGRPKHQLTLKMFRDCGYTGPCYLVLDDTDDTIQEYLDLYPKDIIIIIDKNYYIQHTETISNHPKFASVVYVKNAIEQIARSMNLKAFVVVDDDMTSLRMRYVDGDKLRSKKIESNFDSVFDAIVDYLLTADICTLSPLYTSFFMGGAKGMTQQKIETARFCYAFIFRNSKFDVDWCSDYAEDNITSFELNKIGKKVLGLYNMHADSVPPSNRLSGGMSDTYASNTYLLSMRGNVVEPAYMTVDYYSSKYVIKVRRHNSLPKIISWRYKK